MRVCALLLLSLTATAELQPETEKAWAAYTSFTERRIEGELQSKEGFLVLDFLEPADRSACRRQIQAGEVCVLKRQTVDDEGRAIAVPDGMVHHWYGSILVPGVGIDRVVELAQSYDESAGLYPEVEDSRLLSRRDDVFEIFLRLRRTKILTVHYNTEHEVTYRRHDKTRVSSRSLATRIREISNPGKTNESEKAEASDQGFLWRLSSYWRFEQTDQGTMVECESISLSRSIPAAARWLIQNFLDSVPRESLESTLLPIREHLVR